MAKTAGGPERAEEPQYIPVHDHSLLWPQVGFSYAYESRRLALATHNPELAALFLRWRDSNLTPAQFCQDPAQRRALQAYIRDYAMSPAVEVRSRTMPWLLIGMVALIAVAFAIGFIIVRIPDHGGNSGAVARSGDPAPISTPEATDATNDLKRGLVLHFSFKAPDVNGIIKDESGNDNSGQLTGAIWTDSDGRGAYLFQNPLPEHVSDSIMVPNSRKIRAETVTLAAWFKTTNMDPGRLRKIVYRSGSGDSGYGLNLNNTGKGDVSMWVSASGNNGNHWVKSEMNVCDGQWHQVVGTYDGHEMKLYIDGRLNMGQENMRQWDASLASTASPVEIGHIANPKQDGFDGLISEVRMYNRALEAGEVLALYTFTVNR